MPIAIHGSPNANRPARPAACGVAPRATSKITTPTNASGQNPHGGSEKATSVPPTRQRERRQRSTGPRGGRVASGCPYISALG